MGFQSSFLLINFCYGPKTWSHYIKTISDMWHSTFKIGVAELCSVTEIVPKSPFLCPKRSPIWYDFRAGAKGTQQSVNIALIIKWKLYFFFTCQEMAHCIDLNVPINVQTIGPLFQVTPAQTKPKFVWIIGNLRRDKLANQGGRECYIALWRMMLH